MRDDFSEKTKNLLGDRVCWKCSNPKCRKPTLGAGQEKNRVINIGVASHITAASKGGPRYDENITTEERKSDENGIWLCQSCSKLIDSDIDKYTIEMLKSWKDLSEQMAAEDVEGQTKYGNKQKSIVHINSFPKIETPLNSEETVHIDLINYFNGRYLKNEYRWKDILKEIKHHISVNMNKDYQYFIKLTTHFSIAFIAGRVMNPKSGIRAISIQNTVNGSEIWDSTDYKNDVYETIILRKEIYSNSNNDVALVLSITRQIEEQVKKYIIDKQLPIGEINYCSFKMPAIDSIEDGKHAWLIAKQINQYIEQRSINSKEGVLHIFIAAPISIMFHLGRMSLSYGKGQIYDYDFEKDRTYYPALYFTDGDWI